MKLNYDQLDKEANFRSSLIHVRENAESVLLARREGRLAGRLLRRLDDLLSNMRRIMAINRNIAFFTTGYSWLIQIIPALIVAPAFIRGEIEFGVITQSAAAFSMLVGAFSLIITQFQSISNYAAVLARLEPMVAAMDAGAPSGKDGKIEISNEEGRVAYELLSEHSITYLTVGKTDDAIELYDAVLEINDQGGWTWREIKPSSK